jgi:DNA-binding Lrp family transcriptional regulator
MNRKGRPKKLSEDCIPGILQGRMCGQTWKELAEEKGVTVMTLWRRVKEYEKLKVEKF